MSIEVRKAIRIVKRRHREGVTAGPEQHQTVAQLNREIARVVISWINDRKEAQIPSIESLEVAGPRQAGEGISPTSRFSQGYE